ncbi:MAG: hypothetical protein Q9M20_05795 [Mariprofundaceae bacterium]|nr:hypothetical protein [Mariprofundaceae bacterium]
MNVTRFKSNICRNTLWQLALTSLLTLSLLIIFSDFVTQIYTANQQTSLGLILNGAILSLFLIAMLRLLILLLHYRKEELALHKFQQHLEDDASGLLYGIPEHSIIVCRYHTIQTLRARHATINHQALASTLMADESTRTGSIRFIHNILILCGVFGTILSLSIALFGASSLLESAVSSSGMGMVIHGMSTALSTTMTAILCYLFLGYFFGALQDVQTKILSTVEHISSTRLLPAAQITTESVNSKLFELMQTMSKMLHGMGELTKHMQLSQQDLPELTKLLRQHVEKSSVRDTMMMQQMGQIQSLLREGFRLKDQ